MSKADKKQRHKAKRESKRQEMRRANSVSPLKRLSNAPGVVECWISTGFELAGQIQIFIYKQAAGLAGVSCFLVDRGVVGLKDAWSRMNLDRREFDDMLAKARNHGIAMRRGTPDEARQIVAGGLRWAHQNGMRLPRDWVKCSALIGGVGGWASADISKFKTEFSGHIEDLRQRLLGEPLDSYVRRSDIQFIFSDSAPYMDLKTGRYSHLDYDGDDDDESDFSLPELSDEERDTLMDKFEAVAEVLASQTSAWLIALGEAPSPDLFPAWQMVMLAHTMQQNDNPDATPEEIAALTAKVVTTTIEAADNRHESVERQHALAQASRHLMADPQIAERVTSDVLGRANC